jgi:hypothetical protein
MTTRREALRTLACLPLALHGGVLAAAAVRQEAASGMRGFACALGELADARGLPPARRTGEHLALALPGSARSSAADLGAIAGFADAVWIELPELDRGGIDDGPLAQRIRAASSVALIDGPLIEWLSTLWPARRRSAILPALQECAASGGRLIGRGSSTFVAGAGCVGRGPTREAIGEVRLHVKNPRKLGQSQSCRGLGLGGSLSSTRTRAPPATCCASWPA